MQEAYSSSRRTFAIEKAVANLGQMRDRPHINPDGKSSWISYRLGVLKV